MTSKKRFGVSVPHELADYLDQAVVSTGRDRSSIVAKAIQEYLHEDLHDESEHRCTGVLIYCGEVLSKDLYIGELSSVIKGSCSMVLAGGRVTVLFVEGNYSQIRCLRRKLAETAVLTRYIPLTCLFRRQYQRGAQRI